MLLGSILTVFIRVIPTHFIFKSTNPPTLSFIMSLVAKVFDVCVFNLSYSKYTKVYQYSLFNKNKVVVKWRIKRENLFGPFSANLLLSALYTLFYNKQSKSNFSLTYSSVYNDRMPVCVHCRPRSNVCYLCKS